MILNSRRAQAIASLEDRFINQLALLDIKDDETHSTERMSTFILLGEAVGLSGTSRAAKAVVEAKFLERAIEMIRTSKHLEEKRKARVFDSTVELLVSWVVRF